MGLDGGSPIIQNEMNIRYRTSAFTSETTAHTIIISKLFAQLASQFTHGIGLLVLPSYLKVYLKCERWLTSKFTY